MHEIYLTEYTTDLFVGNKSHCQLVNNFTNAGLVPIISISSLSTGDILPELLLL